MWSVKKMEQYLAEHLSQRTYAHCLRVREEAGRLAARFGGDIEQARLAGLLHDCAKHDGVLELARKFGIQLDVYASGSRELAHGPVGAFVLREIFGIEDEEIISAVYYHTSGRENMTLLEKIIYLADCIEPGRDYPGVEEIREKAMIDLDSAVLAMLASTMTYVIVTGRVLHPDSVYAYNALTQAINQR